MPAHKQTHCKRGHKLTEANSIYSKNYKGRPQRKCRKCHNLRRNAKYNFKYKNDEEFRIKQKRKSAIYKELKWHAHQDQNQQAQNPVC